jgi:hypothetical protein
MTELVECLSGGSYAERPIRLTWRDQLLEISEIQAQWRTPEEKHFRVRTNDGREFELSYIEADDEWQIQPIFGG